MTSLFSQNDVILTWLRQNDAVLTLYRHYYYVLMENWSKNNIFECKYRKISNIKRTKSPNLDVSRLVLQLSLPNPMKPGVKSRMKM